MPDVFATDRPDADLHPSFLVLRDSPQYAPARAIMRELLADFADPDGNFVQQFQTYGFDQRIFELYLDALFREAGAEIDRSHDRPDFVLSKAGQEVCVEATTANSAATGGMRPYRTMMEARSHDDFIIHLEDATPIRLGSPLYTKLKKEYWKLPHVTGRPLVFAIEDFHEGGSLMTSSTPLANYLYGLRSHWYHDDTGKLIISGSPIDKHKLGAKEIPSGFFSLPGAEHVSAVLFSNSGTVPKFNRMGQEGAYPSKDVRMLRWGTAYRHDSNSDQPLGFVYEVGDGDMQETWREGTVLMHNPNALHPVPKKFLGTSVEEFLEDGRVVSYFRDNFHPYASMTEVYDSRIPTRELQKRADFLSQHLIQLYGP